MNNEQLRQQKCQEAQKILSLLDFPLAQENERSALTLLALLDLNPIQAWHEASAPLIGITPIMDWCRLHYAKIYAPNTRETFRRQTMHQFIEAGIVVANPDQPHRAINSPKWCYQIAPEALSLFQTFNSEQWVYQLAHFQKIRQSLQKNYAQLREMQRIPVTLSQNLNIDLSAGEHSQLIKAIIEDFGSRYVPNGKLLYVGDTGQKWGYVDQAEFERLGIELDLHGKMPDVILYAPDQNWLFLVEAVTRHGPVDGKRYHELNQLFQRANLGLIFVTAFATRREMARFVADISWESEVWIAEAPDHLIHFNGSRFLGPY
ncbi:BsuBI/PstI family type II restriction endonuclease [Herpetosiphon llansteffanensis]|uniref:BsuBI/PstI family type II restriction endonuclease n=1 Tax=Herpetosiphon llansteffanensis TaxID=2094568 RepID=UPI000D7D150F|nr:BsuBI/PstI family type II restriction endonuclease [Herpetosiphon llansteffanensis]